MSGIKINAECQKLIDFLEQNPADLTKDGVEYCRQNHNANHQKASGFEMNFDGERSDIHIPSPAWKTGIPAYIYKPKNLVPDPVIMMYFYGGGLVVGSRECYDSMCKEISRLAGCIIVSTVYRLSPEHKFPAHLEDVVAATEWVIENKSSIGGTPISKVGVCGDSAGGFLAASVAHDVNVDFQILVYPMGSKVGEHSSPSMIKYRDGPSFPLRILKWAEQQFVPEETDSSTPKLDLISRPKFDHLPPALILLAEHDVLLDHGKEYAAKLKANGVPVELVVAKETTHGFLHALYFCPKICMENYEKIATFIKKVKLL